MNGEWTPVFSPPVAGEKVDGLMTRLFAFVSSLRKCPKCRALIEESDTLMHELECWK